LTLSRPKTPQPIITKNLNHVITSRTPTAKKFGSIRAGGSSPHIREIYILKRMFTSFFGSSARLQATGETVGRILTLNTSYNAVLRKEVPFAVRKFKFNI